MSDPALVPGAALADAKVTTSDGRIVALSELLGGNPAVIHFMRTATCSACMAHGKVLGKLAEQGRLGTARVVFLTAGGAADAAQVEKVLTPPVAVAAVGADHSACGLKRSGQFQQSATIVVDSDMVVRQATLAAMPHKSFDRVATIAAIDGMAAA